MVNHLEESRYPIRRELPLVVVKVGVLEINGTRPSRLRLQLFKNIANEKVYFMFDHLLTLVLVNTVKPLSGHSKRRPKLDFQDRLSLYAGQKYCRMLQKSILQYFRPLISYLLSLIPLLCLFLSGRLRQVLLKIIITYIAFYDFQPVQLQHSFKILC